MTTVLAQPDEARKLIRSIGKIIGEKPGVFLQILLGLSSDNTFQRIMFCPKFPLRAEDTLDKEISYLRNYLVKHRNQAPSVLWSLYELSRNRRERKRRGQFNTRFDVAKIAVSKLGVEKGQVVLDPGCGSAVFGVALLDSTQASMGDITYFGIEDDPVLALTASLSLELASAPPNWRVIYANFLRLDPEYLKHIGIKQVDRIICNPPFVRHHLLEGLNRVTARISTRSDLRLSGYSGLHSLFLAESVSILKAGGRMVFLFPPGMNEVAYGSRLLHQLRARFDVSPEGQVADMALFVFGSRQLLPAEITLAVEARGEQRLADFARVHRGISTGCNAYFVLAQSEIEKYFIAQEYLKKIVPTKIPMNSFEFTLENWNHYRELDKPCWLLSVPENIPKADLPRSVSDYIAIGEDKGVHRVQTCAIRNKWYSIRLRDGPTPQFFFTYMFRGYPRFVYNPDNLRNLTNLLGVHLNLPSSVSSKSSDKIMTALAQSLTDDVEIMMKRGAFGRRYGGGLVKFEPGDLDQMPVSSNTRALVDKVRASAYGTLF